MKEFEKWWDDHKDICHEGNVCQEKKVAEVVWEAALLWIKFGIMDKRPPLFIIDEELRK